MFFEIKLLIVKDVAVPYFIFVQDVGNGLLQF